MGIISWKGMSKLKRGFSTSYRTTSAKPSLLWATKRKFLPVVFHFVYPQRLQ